MPENAYNFHPRKLWSPHKNTHFTLSRSESAELYHGDRKRIYSSKSCRRSCLCGCLLNHWMATVCTGIAFILSAFKSAKCSRAFDHLIHVIYVNEHWICVSDESKPEDFEIIEAINGQHSIPIMCSIIRHIKRFEMWCWKIFTKIVSVVWAKAAQR